LLDLYFYLVIRGNRSRPSLLPSLPPSLLPRLSLLLLTMTMMMMKKKRPFLLPQREKSKYSSLSC
jgi:hypothetical protein